MTRGRARRIAVGVTGASGAIYAVRTIAALLEVGCHLEIVFSDYGRRLADRRTRTGREGRSTAASCSSSATATACARGTFVLHSNRDLGATLASGSHRCDGMVIVPCSMKTLAGVAHGLSRNLIERAADVMLKERRRLVLVPRETPMSLPDAPQHGGLRGGGRDDAAGHAGLLSAAEDDRRSRGVSWPERS